jgi:hypothetical protein
MSNQVPPLCNLAFQFVYEFPNVVLLDVAVNGNLVDVIGNGVTLTIYGHENVHLGRAEPLQSTVASVPVLLVSVRAELRVRVSCVESHAVLDIFGVKSSHLAESSF